MLKGVRLDIGLQIDKIFPFPRYIYKVSFIYKIAIFINNYYEKRRNPSSAFFRIRYFIYTPTIDFDFSIQSINVEATVLCSSSVNSGNIGSEITISVFFSEIGSEPLPTPKYS